MFEESSSKHDQALPQGSPGNVGREEVPVSKTDTEPREPTFAVPRETTAEEDDRRDKKKKAGASSILTTILPVVAAAETTNNNEEKRNRG